MSTERPLYVVGHKNPDTDSVCSAIVYAAFQDRVLGNKARAFRAGNVNPQTAYVLQRVGISSPPLLTDVYPKIGDIMIRGNQLITLSPQTPVAHARELMLKYRFTFLPVCGEGGMCLGKITTLELLRLPDVLGGLDGNRITLAVDSLATQLGVEYPEVLPEEQDAYFSGSVHVEPEGDQRHTPPPGTVSPVLRIFRSQEGYERWQADPTGPLPTKDDLVIICSGDGTSRRDEQGTVLAPRKPLTEALTAVTLALPVESFIEDTDTRFAPDDKVKDVQVEISKSNLGGFLVTDRNDRLSGVITRMSFLSESRYRVVLVDHNEFSQAVPGIEQAEIVEILDHHRIGIRSTDQPITFINRVVGSTATIVAGLFRSHGASPTEQEAALLLSAILSDTVILRSPTTTEEDRKLAGWLAELAGVDLEAFGREMFEAGSVLATSEAAELVRQDQKHYSEGDVTFLVSQVETVGFSSFWQRRKKIAEALATEVRENGCTFGCLMVSDITAGDTLLVTAGSEEIVSRISYPEVAPQVFELRGVLSRKKQVLPYLMELLRQAG